MMILMCALGVCILGSKLPAAGDFHCGPETAPHKVVRTQPQWSEFSRQEWEHTSWWVNYYFQNGMIYVLLQFFGNLTREPFVHRFGLYENCRYSCGLQDLPPYRVRFLSVQPCWHQGHEPSCSLPCLVGWKQLHSWFIADPYQQSLLHVSFSAWPLPIKFVYLNCVSAA